MVDINELLELADRKEALIHKVLALTGAQRDALDNDDIEKLMETTDEKQQCIDRLQEVTEKFRESCGVISRDFGDDDGVGRIKYKLQSIRDTVDRIVKLEEENKSILVKKLNEVRQQIAKINTEKKAMRSYAGAGTGEGFRIDNKN